MKKFTFFIAIAIATFTTLSAQENSKLSVGLKAGYNTGIGIQANVTLFDFVQDTPFHVRFELGYTSLNPGNSPDARRIFINNATNGTPEKKGHTFDYRLDFLIPVDILNDSFLKVGPRYSNFTGNFNYVGGNENFDFTSNQ